MSTETQDYDSAVDTPKKKGPPTHDEVRADERARVETEMQEQVDRRFAEVDQKMAAMEQNHNAGMANVTAVAKAGNAIPSLKRTKINVSNDIVRGLAHATGGVSHSDVIDPTTGEFVPWTPGCPDWVYANYGGTGGGEAHLGKETYGRPLTEDGRIAEFLFKQAFLNDIKMNQDMLPDAMEAYKERGEVPRLVAPETENAQELAAAAQM